MKFSTFATVALFAGATTFLSACGGTNSTAADEAAIKDVNAKWQQLIVSKDAKAIAGIYAEDGQLLPPNMPRAEGRAAIEQGWNGFVNIPGMALTFETDKLVFAQSGDIAVETATYKFTTAEGTETGKSVVTWHKADGKWQVLTDMFSSDTPPAPPAPAVPASPIEGATTTTDDTSVPPAIVVPETPVTPPAH